MVLMLLESLGSVQQFADIGANVGDIVCGDVVGDIVSVVGFCVNESHKNASIDTLQFTACQ